VGQITTAQNDITESAEDQAGRLQVDWFARGLCTDADPDEFFVEGNHAQKEVRTLCFDCPVRLECLADALDNEVDWGVWGGMTERERRAVLRRAPEVESWFPILREIQEQQDERRRSARAKLAELWRAKLSRENGS